MDYTEIKKQKATIESFCKENSIVKVGHEYHFTLNDKDYIVGPWLVTVRECKHKSSFDKTGIQNHYIMIKASQKRLIDIYTDLKSGYTLNEKGERV